MFAGAVVITGVLFIVSDPSDLVIGIGVLLGAIIGQALLTALTH